MKHQRATKVKYMKDRYDRIGRVTVLCFENGKRVFTFSGLDAFRAMEFILEQNSIGRDTMIFPEGILSVKDSIENDKAHFDEIRRRMERIKFTG